MRRPSAARRRTILLLALMVLVGSLAGLVTACSSSSTFDREKAIGDAMHANSQLTRAQAECYVDRVQKELGTDALDLTTRPRVEDVPRLTTIQIDCIGVVNLGTSVPGTIAPLTDEELGGGSVPRHPGDDAHLDQLYAACKAGSGPACDQLFDQAPIGTEYEEFASTCGGRTKELTCAAVYPDPAAAATTTSTTPTIAPIPTIPPTTN